MAVWSVFVVVVLMVAVSIVTVRVMVGVWFGDECLANVEGKVRQCLWLKEIRMRMQRPVSGGQY